MRWWIVLIAFASIPVDAQARSSRQAQIPNGPRFSCDTCHGEPNAQPGGLNPFGIDVYDNLDGNIADWPAIAVLDSDGDGFINAVELNDPDVEWRYGDPPPGGPVSNPGFANEGICNNDNLEDGEECEPGLLGGATCESLEIGTGELSCYSTCRFDIRECGYCGDGYRHPYDEACDGDDFDDLTCAEASDFAYGILKCTNDCEIDASRCTDVPPSPCGDGVKGWNESCDGADFGEWSCQRLGYDNGVLLCTERCEWNADGCYFGEEPPPGWEPPDAGGAGGSGGTGGSGDSEVDGEATPGGGSGCAQGGETAPSGLVLLAVALLAIRSRRS